MSTFSIIPLSYIILLIINNIQKSLGYSEKSRKLSFCFCFYFISALILGFRGIHVGQDTQNYYALFSEIQHNTFDEIVSGVYYTTEPLYLVLMKIFHILNFEYFSFQIFVAFVFSGLSGYIVYKYSEDPYITTVVYLGCGIYLAAFNIARQMMSLCFVVLVFFSLFNSRWKISIIYSFVAVLFHKTALLPIVPIFVFYLIKNKTKLLKLSPILIFALYPIYEIGLVLTEVLFDNAYANYMSNHKPIQTAGLSKIVWIIECLIALVYIYFIKSHTNKNIIICALSLFYLFFNIIGLEFNYAERIGYYFSFFICFIYAILARTFKDKSLKLIYYIGVITCFLIFFHISTLTPQYMNYRFFFE